MTVFKPYELLPRAVACVMQQEHPAWELLMMLDGSAPTGRFSPRRIAARINRHLGSERIAVHELPRAAGCHGNVARFEALQHARGDYVCWVNHDNLIVPRYLSAHAENFREEPRCVSVVDVDLWKQDRFYGTYPRRLARSRIDLLCFAVPLETAREINAFGDAMSRVYAADWLVFDACRKLLPVRHNRRVVGTHF